MGTAPPQGGLGPYSPGGSRSPEEWGRIPDPGEPTQVDRLPVTPAELLGPLSDLERRFAPDLLYASGVLRLPLPHPRVAVVGTRSPSEGGRAAARQIASELASRGVIVVSGLAEGVDTLAHTGALSAGGSTLAVLGTPLSRVYPATNRDLQHRIMERHLAVSQFPDGYPVRPGNFVMRNRVMALISDATVIVESGERGGSLHQGWEAIRLGRPLFLRHAVLADPNLRWPKEMQRYGAVGFQEAAEILDFVPSVRSELRVDGMG